MSVSKHQTFWVLTLFMAIYVSTFGGFNLRNRKMNHEAWEDPPSNFPSEGFLQNRGVNRVNPWLDMDLRYLNMDLDIDLRYLRFV